MDINGPQNVSDSRQCNSSLQNGPRVSRTQIHSGDSQSCDSKLADAEKVWRTTSVDCCVVIIYLLIVFVTCLPRTLNQVIAGRPKIFGSAADALEQSTPSRNRY